MPPEPINQPNFGGGLNLKDQPLLLDARDALDCLNVQFGERGAVASRQGYARLTGSELTNQGDSIERFEKTDGTKQLLVGCGTRLEAVADTGSVVASATGLTAGTWDFVKVGTPNSEVAYAGQGTDTLRKWTGSAWSAPTATVDGVAGRAMPKAGLLIVHSDDNRLVATGYTTTTGGPNGTTSSPSHVYFSEAGDPETWISTNHVQLEPGDGQKITGVCKYGDLVVVFKQTKFFVFWGVSTDSTGLPVFDYRDVSTGIGLAASRACVETEHGVFFMARDGVYVTEGSSPKLVSDKIGPLWEGNLPVSYRGDAINQASIATAAMTYWQGRVYLAVPTGVSTTNDTLLVFDTRAQSWTVWDIAAADLRPFRVDDEEELVFTYPTGSNYIGRFKGRDRTYLNDDMTTSGTGGVAVTSRWRSGWNDFGAPDQIKRIRSRFITGSGELTLRIYKDFTDSASVDQSVILTHSTDQWADGTGSDTWGDGTSSADLWGPVGGQARKLVDHAIEGFAFSTEFSNAAIDSSFTVHNLTHHTTGARAALAVTE